MGKNNYGHLTEEVLDRLGSIGAIVYRADELGKILWSF